MKVLTFVGKPKKKKKKERLMEIIVLVLVKALRNILVKKNYSCIMCILLNGK